MPSDDPARWSGPEAVAAFGYEPMSNAAGERHIWWRQFTELYYPYGKGGSVVPPVWFAALRPHHYCRQDGFTDRALYRTPADAVEDLGKAWRRLKPVDRRLLGLALLAARLGKG